MTVTPPAACRSITRTAHRPKHPGGGVACCCKYNILRAQTLLHKGLLMDEYIGMYTDSSTGTLETLS